jgi:surface carbohydrate biosynthesis protein
MKSARVALIVDHPTRDLPGLALTAFELCQHGVTCHLVSMNLQYKEIFALRPDFVLFNYLRRSNETLARKLAEAGIRFGLLDTEGGVWNNFNDYTDLLWPDKELLHRASVVCMWGPKMADHVTRAGFFAAEQIRVTGCPRFDFYNPQWRQTLCEGSKPETLDRIKYPSILLNTNYYTINSRFASPEQNMRQLRSQGWSQSRVDDTAEAEQHAIAATIKLAKDLARDFPDTQIIVRPHPFEKPDTYHKPLEHLGNVAVDGEGPVQPQILTSSVVIQRSCTTAIEAGLARIPTLSPQWFKAPCFMPMAEAVSIPCHSYSQVHSILMSIFRRDYQLPCDIQRAIQTTVDDWFYKCDGQSHKRVSNAIIEKLNTKRTVNERLCARFLNGLGISSPLSLNYLSGLIHYSLGASPDWSLHRMRFIHNHDWQNSAKYFELRDINRMLMNMYQRQLQNNEGVHRVTATNALDRGDFSPPISGHAVTLVSDE